MIATLPVVLTIAGFDPSSGAGVTADIKTIAAHGCYGVACITALTVQSTQGVHRVQPVDPEIISKTLRELVSDIFIASVHVGMLGNEQTVETVADFLHEANLQNVVLDPILKSSSGADLLDVAGRRLLIERLVPLAHVITPNIEEAGVLTGMTVTNVDQARASAARLHAMGARAVVITGGDFKKANEENAVVENAMDEKAIDFLSVKNGQGTLEEVFEAQRLVSRSTHGTGCAFATALACQLALGSGLSKAVPLAKHYVLGGIANAYPLGSGTGPLNHFYRMRRIPEV